MMQYFLERYPLFDTWFTTVFGDFSPYLSAILDVIFIAAAAALIVACLHRIIAGWKKLVVTRKGKNEKQLATLCSVLKSVTAFVVWFIAVILVLYRVGLGDTVTSVLATAGIGGLAVGLGAQSLIKDILAGCAMLAEQQISVGDYVSINGNAGTVEEIGLRTIRIRAWKGELFIVPNGSISTVVNYSRGGTMAVVDVPVSNKFNSGEVLHLLSQAMDAMPENDALIKKPAVAGITEMNSVVITYRITAECRSMQHVAAERAIRSHVVQALGEAGIILQEIPEKKSA
ncbi:MAG: mechanosensitive ion channel family protein [Eubacteriales bacterium]|nr:mechanosensitive ion channel family protein [Eubacteriales bacterium]